MKDFICKAGDYISEGIQWLVAFWFLGVVVGLAVKLTRFAWGI